MFEKIVNIGMKILGVFFIIDAIIVFLGYLTPTVFSSGITRLVIALFLLSATYSKPERIIKNV